MMCNRCNKPATVHIKEISNGTIVALDFCDQCAAAAGYCPQDHLPLNDILNEFVAAHSHLSDGPVLQCPDCGMTWQEFKDTGLLGCQKDYDLFVKKLDSVIEKAQHGGTHHTGKTRCRNQRTGEPANELNAVAPRALPMTAIKQLQAELAKAVATESYEQAAKLRDQIRLLENSV